uniref:F-box domain-containing protein n=1 Tax=Mycena chlorophos TaxID=658473 RepID=A0ABQ0LYF8_MYCCL|nr:predicted protein [Mycena chlorophos]
MAEKKVEVEKMRKLQAGREVEPNLAADVTPKFSPLDHHHQQRKPARRCSPRRVSAVNLQSRRQPKLGPPLAVPRALVLDQGPTKMALVVEPQANDDTTTMKSDSAVHSHSATISPAVLVPQPDGRCCMWRRPRAFSVWQRAYPLPWALSLSLSGIDERCMPTNTAKNTAIASLTQCRAHTTHPPHPERAMHGLLPPSQRAGTYPRLHGPIPATPFTPMARAPPVGGPSNAPAQHLLVARGVCHLWREVVLTTPQLRTTIELDLELGGRITSANRWYHNAVAATLPWVLKQSAGLPLTFHLGFVDPSDASASWLAVLPCPPSSGSP